MAAAPGRRSESPPPAAPNDCGDRRREHIRFLQTGTAGKPRIPHALPIGNTFRPSFAAPKIQAAKRHSTNRSFAMNEMTKPAGAAIKGKEHWTEKGRGEAVPVGEMRRRPGEDPRHHPVRPWLLHGVAADLRPAAAGPSRFLGDGVVRGPGYDTWSVDMEGYGRSTKDRDNNAPIAYGADDCFAAAPYIQKLRGQAAVPGLRHLFRRPARGPVRAAAPGTGGKARARRHGLDRRGLADACPAAQEAAGVLRQQPRPIDKPFVYSIFNRDHPGTADDSVIEAFADAITALDNSCRPAPMSTCAPACRCAIRRRSRCRPSSCAANGTVSPRR